MVRLKMPREGQCRFHDLVRGDVAFDWANEQDHVVQRADGTCLYHLASAVDDNDFKITPAQLEQAIGRATSAGVSREAIVVDPGFGFAKRPEHSYAALAGLERIAAALDRPVLSGPSRKSFLNAAIGERENNVSNHLARLRAASLVRPIRHQGDARWVYYERDETACALAATSLSRLLT